MYPSRERLILLATPGLRVGLVTRNVTEAQETPLGFPYPGLAGQA